MKMNYFVLMVSAATYLTSPAFAMNPEQQEALQKELSAKLEKYQPRNGRATSIPPNGEKPTGAKLLRPLPIAASTPTTSAPASRPLSKTGQSEASTPTTSALASRSTTGQSAASKPTTTAPQPRPLPGTGQSAASKPTTSALLPRPLPVVPKVSATAEKSNTTTRSLPPKPTLTASASKPVSSLTLSPLKVTTTKTTVAPQQQLTLSSLPQDIIDNIVVWLSFQNLNRLERAAAKDKVLSIQLKNVPQYRLLLGDKKWETAGTGKTAKEQFQFLLKNDFNFCIHFADLYNNFFPFGVVNNSLPLKYYWKAPVDKDTLKGLYKSYGALCFFNPDKLLAEKADLRELLVDFCPSREGLPPSSQWNIKSYFFFKDPPGEEAKTQLLRALFAYGVCKEKLCKENIERCFKAVEAVLACEEADEFDKARARLVRGSIYSMLGDTKGNAELNHVLADEYATPQLKLESLVGLKLSKSRSTKCKLFLRDYKACLSRLELAIALLVIAQGDEYAQSDLDRDSTRELAELENDFFLAGREDYKEAALERYRAARDDKAAQEEYKLIREEYNAVLQLPPHLDVRLQQQGAAQGLASLASQEKERNEKKNKRAN